MKRGECTLEDAVVDCLAEAFREQESGADYVSSSSVHEDGLTLDGDFDLRAIALKLQQMFRIER